MPFKENKITRKKDFEKIFKKGTSFKENFLILKVSYNSSQPSRFAFIVSQKVSKKATIRNNIRRRLKELIRLWKKEIKKGADGVFIVLPGFESKDFKETQCILNNLLKKAKLI